MFENLPINLIEDFDTVLSNSETSNWFDVYLILDPIRIREKKKKNRLDTKNLYPMYLLLQKRFYQN